MSAVDAIQKLTKFFEIPKAIIETWPIQLQCKYLPLMLFGFSVALLGHQFVRDNMSCTLKDHAEFGHVFVDNHCYNSWTFVLQCKVLNN